MEHSVDPPSSFGKGALSSRDLRVPASALASATPSIPARRIPEQAVLPRFPDFRLFLSHRPPADCQFCVYEMTEKRKEASPT